MQFAYRQKGFYEAKLGIKIKNAIRKITYFLIFLRKNDKNKGVLVILQGNMIIFQIH